MPTLENPSEQPEREFPEPMPVIDEQAIKGAGFHIMRRMYLEPLKPYIFFNDWVTYQTWVYTVADLIVLGYVAVIEGGFQLTALGRLVFHEWYAAFQAKLERQAAYERLIEESAPRDEYDEWFWMQIYQPW